MLQSVPPSPFTFALLCTDAWACALASVLSELGMCAHGNATYGNVTQSNATTRVAVVDFLSHVVHETRYFTVLAQPADGGTGLFHQIPANWASNVADAAELFPGDALQSRYDALPDDAARAEFVAAPLTAWRLAAAWMLRTNRVLGAPCGVDLFTAPFDLQVRCIFGAGHNPDASARREARAAVESALASVEGSVDGSGGGSGGGGARHERPPSPPPGFGFCATTLADATPGPAACIPCHNESPDDCPPDPSNAGGQLVCFASTFCLGDYVACGAAGVPECAALPFRRPPSPPPTPPAPPARPPPARPPGGAPAASALGIGGGVGIAAGVTVAAIACALLGLFAWSRSVRRSKAAQATSFRTSFELRIPRVSPAWSAPTGRRCARARLCCASCQYVPNRPPKHVLDTRCSWQVCGAALALQERGRLRRALLA